MSKPYPMAAAEASRTERPPALPRRRWAGALLARVLILTMMPDLAISALF
ncbi:MAG: hypothetical protein ACLQJR_17860 [Stellaceae bacterium]